MKRPHWRKMTWVLTLWCALAIPAGAVARHVKRDRQERGERCRRDSTYVIVARPASNGLRNTGTGHRRRSHRWLLDRASSGSLSGSFVSTDTGSVTALGRVERAKVRQ